MNCRYFGFGVFLCRAWQQSRTLLSQQNLPAPPDGYEVVKFRTRFASKGETVETVTLERAGDQWRIVAVLVG